MREITIKIYTFDELTKEAQEKILERHRYKWCPEYYDAEHPTIREFVHTLTRQGFAVHHRSPVTHVRRAHWHTFRVGEGRKKIQVKWLAPVVVNADGEQKNIVTINKVEE